MKLQAESGDAFEFAVLRYEFPDITEDRWDSNWLVVSGHVRSGEQVWQFVEPCVTTFELAELAEWLGALGSGPQRDAEYAFTEPHLKFSYVVDPEPRLRVRFAHKIAPPWLTEFARKALGFHLEFPISEVDAQAVIEDLRRTLIEFPIRGGAA